MTDDLVVGWKVDRDVPVLLTLPAGRRLPTAVAIEDRGEGDGPECGLCRQDEPCRCLRDGGGCGCSCGRCQSPRRRWVCRYPSDPLLFYAVLGVASGWVGRG